MNTEKQAVRIYSEAATDFFKKNHIDLEKLSLEKKYFFTLEDYNSNTINISIERNIILIGKYQFLNNLIYPIIEFCLFRQGTMLVPVSLTTGRKTINSSVYSDTNVKITSPERHTELIDLLSKHLEKYKNFDFIVTEQCISDPTTNIM